MPASDYLKSLKGNFDPTKKGEKKSKMGRAGSGPTLNQNPPVGKLSLGSRK
jgi:hypothetical protein